MSKGLHKIIEYKQSLCIFISYEHDLHIPHILIGSISEVYTYVLFDVVSVDVYLYTVYVPVAI